jgi:predicted AlkP superfamily pyrophosphatase or phosphodiesterase
MNEQLGMDSIPDLLALSLSSPDYIGHAYGPNSIEEEDCYLRLDKDLGDFLDFLEEKIGKDACLIFLTADHGSAHAPAFLRDHKIPSGNFDKIKTADNLNAYLSNFFKTGKLVKAILNDQVYFDKDSIRNEGLIKETVFEKAIEYLIKDTCIYRVFTLESTSQTTLNIRVKDAISSGYYPGRSGDLQIMLRPQYIDGYLSGGTSHGSWNPYDSHIPLNWYGWNIQPGKTNREVSMTDIAATVSALLHIQMPSGCVGHVIEEITR